MQITIPEAYYDLLNGPRVAALTTVMPDGQPQSSLVWCDEDGECACVNTTRERQKGRNMRANPKVSLLIELSSLKRERSITSIGLRGSTLSIRTTMGTSFQ